MLNLIVIYVSVFSENYNETIILRLFIFKAIICA